MIGKSNLRHALVLFLTASLSFTGFGQSKYDKAFQKAEDRYAAGDYKTAIDLLDAFKSKTDRKFGKENKYTSQYLLARARYSLASGMIMDFDNYLNKVLQYANATYPQNSEPYGMILLEAGELYNRQGSAFVGRDLLGKSLQILKASGRVTDEQRARINLNLAECMAQQGFYRQALSLLRSEGAYFKQRTGKNEVYTDERGQTKTRKVEEKELRRRMGEYGRWLTDLANTYARQGMVTRADSAFLAAGNWILRNLGRSSEAYVLNEIRFADMLVENGLSTKSEFPEHAGYQSALNHILEKSRNSHMLAMKATERQIKWLMYQGESKEVNARMDAYEKLIADQFPKGSLYTTTSKAIYYDIRVEGELKPAISSEVMLLMSKSNNLPKNHLLVAELYSFLYDLAIYLKNYRGAQDHLRKVIEIKEALFGKDAPEAHLSRLKLANHLLDYTNNISDALDIYKVSYDSVVAPQIGPWQKDHLNILNHLSTLYEFTDRYTLADKTLAHALDVAESKYGRSDPLFGVELTLVAGLRMRMGQYQQADKEISEAIRNLDEHRKKTEWKVAFMNALQAQAKLFGLRGMFSEAESNLEQAGSILRKSKDENLIVDELATIRELASLYIQLGRFNETELLLDRLISEYDRAMGQQSAHLIEPLINKGYLNLAKGDYPVAEKNARRAYDIAVKVYTDRSTKTAAAQRLLSDIYFTLGDYAKAEEFVLKALESQQAQFGKDHMEVAKSLAQLGLIRYSRGDDPGTVEKPLADARAIIAEQLGTDNPPYAEVLKTTAILHIAGKKYVQALSMLSQAEQIWATKTGSNDNIRAASIYALTGDVYYHLKRYDESEKFYNRGKQIFEEKFSRTHPEYVRIVSKLSRIYYQTRDYKKSKKFIEEALANYELYIKQYFPALSEREKAKYWNTIRSDFEFYNTLAFSQNDEFRDLTGKVYNYQLLTKALLLNSSMKIRERILSSTNDELKKTYNLWLEKKELLTKALSLNSAQLADQDINPTTLAAEAEALEKLLSEKSEIFGQNLENRKVTFENIQKSLNKNDVAIEIIRYRHFDHTFTDSVVYVGVLMKSDLSRPDVIRFPKGHQMEGRYFTYYRNAMQDLIPDQYSYDVFWAPIQNKLGPQAGTIYLSPDGVYNQINLEAIPIPNRDGSYIIDQANIVLVNNTKDIYFNKIRTRTKSSNNSATMVGNPLFYTRKDVEQSFPSLPGTEVEISELRTLLTAKGWQASGFTTTEATEEQIKSINNPKIFHIATHGFYAPTVERNLADEMTETDNSLSENPLLKSGLLLKGGGDILSRNDRNYNSDNGILTAYEAMNLNLDNTDLVVLSACETGLGQIASGEGVYGLQRAFLMAGAKTLIMSMFKVDDEATQKLIINFYDKWLTTGNLRQSFKDAKLDLRREYPDPLFWGSFMMIGLD